jgi:hypothetical protein
VDKSKAAKEAAAGLSRMLERELSLSVDPTVLRLFVQLHWRRLSILAHRIAEEA